MLLMPVVNHSVTVNFDMGAQPTHEGHPPVASYVVVNRLMVAEHQRAERADTFAVHATFLVTADRILFVQLRQPHHDTPVHVALKFRVGLDRVSVILHKHTSDVSGKHRVEGALCTPALPAWGCSHENPSAGQWCRATLLGCLTLYLAQR